MLICKSYILRGHLVQAGENVSELAEVMKGKMMMCLLQRSPLWKTVSAQDRDVCLSVADDGEFW